MPRPKKKRKVLKAFYETEKDATIEDIADKAGVNRRTAKKWIDKLMGQGDVVKSREIGRTSLYRLAKPSERGAQNSSSDNSQTKRETNETKV